MKATLAGVLGAVGAAKVYDLSMEMFLGMPRYPSHPPFLYGLAKKHGDIVTVAPDGREVCSAVDAFSTGAHVGTHIDGLGHFSCNGQMFGGTPVAGMQSYERGIEKLGVETIAPIVRRGVLLDIARLHRNRPLAKDYIVTPGDLDAACARQGVEVRAGDVVLLRTAWAQYWPDPVAYVTGGKGAVATNPGPGDEAARWLSARGIFAAGSDTVGFEQMPSAMPVHVHLLVETGIHIIEVLNLEELSRDLVWEFLFIALPLKIRGGTGAPLRPIALAV